MQESIAAFKDFTLDDASGQKPKPKPKAKKEPKEEGKAKQKPDEGKAPKQEAKAAPPPPKPSSGKILLMLHYFMVDNDYLGHGMFFGFD